MKPTRDIQCVQACSKANKYHVERHSKQYRIPIRRRPTTRGRGVVARDLSRCYTKKVIRATPEQSAGGQFLPSLSRARPGWYCSSPAQADNQTGVKHGRWNIATNKPTCLKRLQPHMATERSQINVRRARVRAEASDWLRCAEGRDNAYGSL
jgi:hypothetical protein